MLRYRVAILLLIFLFLGIAINGGMNKFNYSYLLAAITLLLSYVSATTINDIVDKKVDKINHPLGQGRPLVTGKANEKELYFLNISTSFLALFLSLFIGLKAMIIMIISLTIAYIYSLDPIKVSYKTHFAHIFLSVAYVIIPYSLGIVVSNLGFYMKDLIFLTGITVLFFGRIILKDFRDKEGDSKYGKPTFLLKYGKSLTCLISFISILIANVLLLFFALSYFDFFILSLLQLYFFSIYFMAYRLWKSTEKMNEQMNISIGAKMGNGLLLTVLGLFILQENNASVNYQIFFSLSIAFIFFISLYLLLRNPEYINMSYRG